MGNEVYNNVIASKYHGFTPGGEACIESVVCVPKSFVISDKNKCMNIKKITFKNLLAGIAIAAIVPFTVAASGAFQDKLIVKNTSNQVIAEYMVPAGTNHREYVASQLGVPHSNVEWLSGDTEYNRAWGYEAHLLVRSNTTPPTPQPSSQDKLIVKNTSNQVIAEYMVASGTNHVSYVAQMQGVATDRVEWLSGDTEYDRAWGYEAHLLVR